MFELNTTDYKIIVGLLFLFIATILIHYRPSTSYSSGIDWETHLKSNWFQVLVNWLLLNINIYLASYSIYKIFGIGEGFYFDLFLSKWFLISQAGLGIAGWMLTPDKGAKKPQHHFALWNIKIFVVNMILLLVIWANDIGERPAGQTLAKTGVQSPISISNSTLNQYVDITKHFFLQETYYKRIRCEKRCDTTVTSSGSWSREIFTIPENSSFIQVNIAKGESIIVKIVGIDLRDNSSVYREFEYKSGERLRQNITDSTRIGELQFKNISNKNIYLIILTESS